MTGNLILVAAENDWQIPQEVPTAEPLITTTIAQTYGFLNLHSGYFKHVGHTENEVNELGADVETCTVQERRLRRWKHEEEKWDEEHYMSGVLSFLQSHLTSAPRADYADDEYIRELILWKNPRVADSAPFQFTDEENLALLNLPRKECMLSSTLHHRWCSDTRQI
jgi:protein SHQ1